MSRLTIDRRPSEIVRNYLEMEFNKPNVLSGDRLPSINTLARHLNVSPSTVQAVLGEMAREGVVRSVRGKGVFLVKDEEPAQEGSPRIIAINLPAQEMTSSNIWAGLISLGIIGELSKSKPAMLLRSSKQSLDGEVDEELLRRECEESDGGILFTRQGSLGVQKVIGVQQAYEAAGKPVVFINPPFINSTQNFVSTDYFGNAFRLCRAWIASGRQKIHLVLHARPGRAVSALLTLMGFTAAMDAAEEAQFTYQVSSYPEKAGAEAFLKEHEKNMPDAVYFFSSSLAEGVVTTLRQRGVSVPDTISVAAGTSDERLEMRQLDLSVFSQSLSCLGSAAVRMLAWRFEHANELAAGIYLPCQYVAGSTTRPEENELMRNDAVSGPPGGRFAPQIVS